MRIPITMPQLGESMAEATVVSLGIKSGQTVKADQDIIEVETNKAVFQVTSSCDGEIAELLVERGGTYGVGAVLGYIEATAEEVEKRGLGRSAEATPEDSAPSVPLRAEDGADAMHGGPDLNPPVWAAGQYASSGAALRVDKRLPAVAPVIPSRGSGSGGGFLSPRVRARMSEAGLNESDLASIGGTGSSGRVTADDVERYLFALAANDVSPAMPMRLSVADAMRRSWARPLATVGRLVKLDALLAHRAAATEPKPGPALYAVRALALALAEDRQSAARLVGNKLIVPKSIDIGCAVEVDEGIMVPVLRQVDGKALAELIAPYRDLVEAARKRTLAPDAFSGSIASVTNYGPFNLEWATPIPLPDESLILGLGATRKHPEWDAEIEDWMPVNAAQITLSFDHRVIDGGRAGRLLAKIVSLLEAPDQL
jgi:pyruvate/2-oxoglutarate dehydrogenase complex dihydrolipoamide acyltransferase (E2) component